MTYSKSAKISTAPAIVLGIETSCDETAVALVNSDRQILSNLVYSQIAEHQAYGGVVPEIAARNHMLKLPLLLEQCLAESRLSSWDEIDAVAVTAGPGLIGGLIVGVMAAKGMAAGLAKPCIPVNHLVGHALTPRLVAPLDFPYLLLLTSGGHCFIALVYSASRYVVLGQTVDDAAGEAFDKVAKSLGIGYPGGPQVERWAEAGDCEAYKLPEPFVGAEHCNFSFSGLKTAVNRLVLAEKEAVGLMPRFISDICASFQDKVATIMVDRLKCALQKCREQGVEVSSLVVSGGVAANQHIRRRLDGFAGESGLILHASPMSLCTDNAAMIAWAGIEMMAERDALIALSGEHRWRNISDNGWLDLGFAPRSRWPIGES